MDLHSFSDYYTSYRQAFVETIGQLDMRVVQTIMETLERVRRERKRLFVIGNGGSAASASHWACDFGKGVNVQGIDRFRVSSVADQGAWLTALANDMSYADVFVEPLRNTLEAGDVVVGLSVSGDSENVVRAFEYARDANATVIAIVGANQGRMSRLAHTTLTVPSEDYGIVEDTHMFVNHVISQFLRRVYLTEAERQKP